MNIQGVWLAKSSMCCLSADPSQVLAIRYRRSVENDGGLKSDWISRLSTQVTGGWRDQERLQKSTAPLGKGFEAAEYGQRYNLASEG
jgi:hypothetical protein